MCASLVNDCERYKSSSMLNAAEAWPRLGVSRLLFWPAPISDIGDLPPQFLPSGATREVLALGFAAFSAAYRSLEIVTGCSASTARDVCEPFRILGMLFPLVQFSVRVVFEGSTIDSCKSYSTSRWHRDFDPANPLALLVRLIHVVIGGGTLWEINAGTISSRREDQVNCDSPSHYIQTPARHAALFYSNSVIGPLHMRPPIASDRLLVVATGFLDGSRTI